MSCNKKCGLNNRYSNIDFDFGTPSRFDLEIAIAQQMSVVDNLNTVIEDILEGDGFSLDPDNLVNTLQGIINLHAMNHHKLWDTFVNLFRLDGQLYAEYDVDTADDEDDEYEEDYNG